MQALEIEKAARAKGADLFGFADVSLFPGDCVTMERMKGLNKS